VIVELSAEFPALVARQIAWPQANRIVVLAGTARGDVLLTLAFEEAPQHTARLLSSLSLESPARRIASVLGAPGLLVHHASGATHLAAFEGTATLLQPVEGSPPVVGACQSVSVPAALISELRLCLLCSVPSVG
jgi:hypothetical protein